MYQPTIEALEWTNPSDDSDRRQQQTLPNQDGAKCVSNPKGMNLKPIIPIRRKEPFDDPAYLFELKLDGLRGIANTVRGRMLSKNGNRMRRFETLLDALPPGYIFDGEIVALDGDGRSSTTCCLAGGSRPTWRSTCCSWTAGTCGPCR
jgi:hypothetical protein